MHYCHSGNISSKQYSDIVIQWEWSNFDPSQNPNPQTDHDKTLHSWLRPRRTRNPKFVPMGCKGSPAKYVKYKASLFILF